MRLKDGHGMTGSVGPDQTVPSDVSLHSWFAQTYMSQCLEFYGITLLCDKDGAAWLEPTILPSLQS